MAIITPAAKKYDPIVLTEENTVVTEYDAVKTKELTYESEAQLEKRFIEILQGQAYEYVRITKASDLEENLRVQLEKLNEYTFSDSEWERFFKTTITNNSYGVLEKTTMIQREPVQLLQRDNGLAKNITLIDRTNVHNNSLQVINQYATDGGNFSNRYDVTILVNGLPMVHVELKRRGVDIKEAFNQISRYKRDSFWADSGLFEYVQIFVISNGTRTKYYSNTVRRKHVDDDKRNRRQASADSFEFTSWWADATNKAITELTAFAKTFFARHTLLNILTRYCVFTVDQELLVMRPYQIVATERILRKILISTNYKTQGSLNAGGYVWHTTGSGKTLTSFKTAQLATGIETVSKVLFVVDRKDLDYQTMREYDAFEKGAANSNKSTAVLKRQIENPASKIIITTIQKLSTFIKQNPNHPVFKEHMVMIFDECHRSQFGDMHKQITKSFKKYHLFGFTGTPIFSDNAGTGGDVRLKTTADAFGERLHTYTIVDAIADKNVLPFKIEYHNTVSLKKDIEDREVYGIETEEAMRSPQRLTQVANYILDHYDQKTKRQESYTLKDKRVKGFNSILATASIDAAKSYYNIINRLQDERYGDDETKRLKTAIIFSYAPNEEEAGGLLGEEGFETDELDASSQAFLQDAIADYNETFKQSWETSVKSFEGYYKDVSERMKKRELDLLIVVNMFLTGFDSKTINTLWVDKNLHSHGLIQAFSRTNRILNSVKTYGNIVCFRNLEEATDDALALFGNKDAKGTVLLKPYADYLNSYAEKVNELRQNFELDGTDMRIIGEENQKNFIKIFGEILRLRNVLTSFDEFEDQDILNERAVQDYKSIYLDLYREMRELNKTERESITDDVVFEIELIKQVEVGVDHILMLVDRYRKSKGNGEDVEIREEISRAVNSSPSLHNKKDLIENFIERISGHTGDVQDEWKQYIREQADEELTRIIQEEKLHEDKARALVEESWQRGGIPSNGTRISDLLTNVGSRFGRAKDRSSRKTRLTERLQAFYERFSGVIG
ncbi:type I restriction endonuclease subunit R [Rothia terrae]|uniref:type I restriction endonuclease subunit R n=1 Tax=Rothia terrae TaxID=396015 RepID=UPI0028819674|nr:type I restriction endonuclease subunit R [Rothia terrae]MDT0188916.1 type I restriction endonuclease subunit R [Rothia terrae]